MEHSEENCSTCAWHDSFSWVCFNGLSEHRADFTDHRSNTRHIKTVAYLVIVIAFLYTCIPGRPKRST